MPSAAKTPSFASAIASAARHDSMPVPIVTTRVDPCLVCALDERAQPAVARVEVRVRVGHATVGGLHPRELLLHDPLRVELREERPRLTAAAWPGGEPLGSQRPDHPS